MAGRPRVLPPASGDAIAPRPTHDTIDTIDIIVIILSISTTCISTTTAICHTTMLCTIVAVVGIHANVGTSRVEVIVITHQHVNVLFYSDIRGHTLKIQV